MMILLLRGDLWWWWFFSAGLDGSPLCSVGLHKNVRSASRRPPCVEDDESCWYLVSWPCSYPTYPTVRMIEKQKTRPLSKFLWMDQNFPLIDTVCMSYVKCHAPIIKLHWRRLSAETSCACNFAIVPNSERDPRTKSTTFSDQKPKIQQST